MLYSLQRLKGLIQHTSEKALLFLLAIGALKGPKKKKKKHIYICACESLPIKTTDKFLRIVGPS